MAVAANVSIPPSASLYYRGPTSVEDYLSRILPLATFQHSEIQALYAPSQFNGNYSEAFVALMSQGGFLCGTRRMAGYIVGKPTYLYTYSHSPEFYFLSAPYIVIRPGAYHTHTAEVFSLFQTLAASLYGDSIFDADELPLAKSVRRYWTNMITTGQPNDNLSFAWPQYSSAIDQTLVLDKNTTVAVFIDMFPNCDLLSNVQVKVYGEYLGLNITCTVGNKCYIVDPAKSTASINFNKTLHGSLCIFSFLLIQNKVPKSLLNVADSRISSPMQSTLLEERSSGFHRNTFSCRHLT